MRALALLFFIAITGSLTAASDFINFEAVAADYNGEELHLSGGVFIEHEFGKLRADRAWAAGGKFLSFDEVNINGSLSLLFSEGGELTADEAKVSYAQRVGTFIGLSRQVVYRSRYGDEQIPLIISSDSAEVSFVKAALKSIVALGNVSASYNHDLVLMGERACYTSTALDLEGDGCSLTTGRGDRLVAKAIHLDMARRLIACEDGEGLLLCSKESPIAFRSEKIAWSDVDKSISLSGSSQIENPLFGMLVCHDHLLIKHEMREGSVVISRIEAKGPIRLVGAAGNSVLECCGSAIFDERTQQLSLTKGEESQIHYNDATKECYADNILIDYALQDGKALVLHLQLSGDVSILNRAEAAGEESGEMLQYVLADRADFFPEKEELLLVASQENGRVLLFDRINHMQMSAAGIRCCRQGKIEEVKGIGDVRFRFLDYEIDQLKRRFKFESLNIGH